MNTIKSHTDPTICPVCGAEYQESFDYDFDLPNCIWYSYRCSECNARWDEVYDLKPMYIEIL